MQTTLKEGKSAAGTKVWLVDTPYRATIDSGGRLQIADLLPGPYELVVLDSRLDSIGLNIPTPLRFVAVRDSTIRASLVVPTAEDFVVDRCVADKAYARGDSLLLVRVMSPQGDPVAGARIDVEMSASKINPVTTRTSEVRSPDVKANEAQVSLQRNPMSVLREGAVTGTDGLLAVCTSRLQPRTSVVVKVRRGEAWKNVTQLVEKRLTIIKVVLEP